MDILDGAGLGQRQEVVVALLVAGAVAEAIAAEIIFDQLQRLDFRAHRAVEHENAFAGGSLEGSKDFASVARRLFGAEQVVQVGIGHGRTLRYFHSVSEIT